MRHQQAEAVFGVSLLFPSSGRKAASALGRGLSRAYLDSRRVSSDSSNSGIKA